MHSTNNTQLLFLIGYPRCGTKLLLNLLGNSSEIGIVKNETNFIGPFLKYYDKLYNKNKNFNSNKDNLISFLLNTDHARINRHLIKKDLLNDSDDLKNLLYTYLSFFNNNRNIKYLIEKSPSNIKYLKYFKIYLPSSKYIYLIRDPIYVVSSHENTWGKHWIVSSREYSIAYNYVNKQCFLNSEFIKIKYEDVVLHTKESIKEIVNFLDINYQNEMLSLKIQLKDMAIRVNALLILQT